MDRRRAFGTNRALVWILTAPVLLAGCYGSKMLRQPVTVDQTAEDVDAVRQQQAELETRMQALERANSEQAEMIRRLRAENGSRWDELENRLLAIDSKLRDLLGGGSRPATRPPRWSAEPSRPASPGGATELNPGVEVPPSTAMAPGSAAVAARTVPRTAVPGGTVDDVSSPEVVVPGAAPGPGDSTAATGPGAQAGVIAADTVAAGAAGSASPANEAEVKKIYDQAYLDYSRGNYSLAVLGFREYLRRSPTSELADNAQYWLGEAYYAQREFNTAIQEFLRVVEQYPDGDTVPAALLKIGYAYLQVEDRPAARRYLKQVLDRFPNSEEAELARRKLRTAGLD